jgi:hypothetical protein
MDNVVYFRINHDEIRFTDGYTRKLGDPGKFSVGDEIQLDEPDGAGVFFITKVSHKNAIGGGTFPHFEVAATLPSYIPTVQKWEEMIAASSDDELQKLRIHAVQCFRPNADKECGQQWGRLAARAENEMQKRGLGL